MVFEEKNILTGTQARVAECFVRTGLLRSKRKLRVDLHGVSVFGPGGEHTLIRWEWIKDIGVEGGVVVRSHNAEVKFPPGAFGRSPQDLEGLLKTASALDKRGEVIGRLAGAGS